MSILRTLACLVALTVAGCATTARKQPLEPEPITVRLIAFNDFHGQLADVGQFGGVVKQLQRGHHYNAIVAAGDLIGGSPLSSALFHDEPTIISLGLLGLDLSSVGNHEFDEGIDELKRMQNGGCRPTAPKDSCPERPFRGALFKYLAANVVNSETRKQIFPGYAIKTFETIEGKTLNVGFIGAVTRSTPDLVVKDGVRNLTFLDEASSINAAVPALRKLGAQVIVLLIHEGGYTSATRFDDDTCPDFEGALLPILDRLDPAIEVVVSGHTHRTYICRRGGRLITSAGSKGEYVTSIDLTLDPQTFRLTSSTARQVDVAHESVEKYWTVVELERFYTKLASPLTDRTIAAISKDILKDPNAAGESQLGDLIADAQLAATSPADKGGAQIAIVNLSGIRTSLDAKAGRVRYGDMHAVHPFGNALVTVSMTGAEIHSMLEKQWLGGTPLQVSQGFSFTWSSTASPGSKVDPKSIKLNGKPLDPAKKYRVAANEFLAAGGDGYSMMSGATERVRTVLDIEALEQYLATHSPVKPPLGGRISRKD